ncbi:MAG: CinA family protein [Gammaproteobacteria bacterium]|nr:CinA family protein [Gammaproteobacteria bacterium]MCW5582670.1 CinA family protein [Gammaproteobacteria bacterium]
MLVLETAKKLKATGLTLATAESCTGGGLSYWLTSVPGSSDWFERGFITYSNAAKIEMLNVNAQTLEEFGAVSEETAREMAEGALQNSHAHLAIAITGIAGPDGGSAEKPVGTVWMAWSGKNFNTIAHLNVFKGDRQDVRLASIVKAMETLLGLL